MALTSSKELFSKIRIDFLFNNPFLSVIALSIKLEVVENRENIFTTNGEVIYFDASKIEKYSFDELKYKYAHTLFHVLLKHPFRIGGRDEDIWNLSADIVTNLILSKLKNIGERPSDEFIDIDLEGKSVEEVYAILKKEDEEEEQKSPSPDIEKNESSDGKNDGLDSVIIQAINIAKEYGGGESFRVEIEELIKPTINIDEILREYLNVSQFNSQYSYTKQNRKFIHQGLYLPAHTKANESLNLYIALDSSASVTLDEYRRFLGLVIDICTNFYEYSIVVVPFDNSVIEDLILKIDTYSDFSDEELLIPKGDGGTNFDAVIEYVNKENLAQNSTLLVLSDGEFEINLPLYIESIFLLTNRKNLKRFEDYGKTINFTF